MSNIETTVAVAEQESVPMMEQDFFDENPILDSEDDYSDDEETDISNGMKMMIGLGAVAGCTGAICCFNAYNSNSDDQKPAYGYGDDYNTATQDLVADPKKELTYTELALNVTVKSPITTGLMVLSSCAGLILCAQQKYGGSAGGFDYKNKFQIGGMCAIFMTFCCFCFATKVTRDQDLEDYPEAANSNWFVSVCGAVATICGAVVALLGMSNLLPQWAPQRKNASIAVGSIIAFFGVLLCGVSSSERRVMIKSSRKTQ